jgi:DNA repair protein RecN (Recombination protein N)
MLDSFAKNEAVFEEYSAKYRVYREIKQRLEVLDGDSKEREIRLDMLRYRINELKSAGIKVGEKEELEAERKQLANAEKIITRAGEGFELLYGRDGSASELISSALGSVSALEGIIPEAEKLSERIESVKYEIIDISDTLKGYLESDVDDAAARLDDCESRLELIKKLESKYKTDSDSFPELLAEWEQELNINENSEEEKSRLQKELKVAKKEMVAAAEVLSETREKAAKILGKRVAEELCELDMPSVRFEVSLEHKECESDGADIAEFLISANKGELPKPMSKIASGGELSRIMLCLKCVFADSEAIGTLIFDEIDTGVSGSTSEKIGLRLKKAADGGKTQVICVTHSAILAAKADAHFKISKSESDGRTVTNVKKLDRTERRDEIARILGGVNISETVLKAAEEMLKDED